MANYSKEEERILRSYCLVAWEGGHSYTPTTAEIIQRALEAMRAKQNPHIHGQILVLVRRILLVLASLPAGGIEKFATYPTLRELLERFEAANCQLEKTVEARLHSRLATLAKHHLQTQFPKYANRQPT